ncbi:MAG: M67 family metallopeptidase [Sulfolobales archaeon]
MFKEASRDRESCGLLGGRIRDSIYEATHMMFIKNISEDPNTFIMDPLETVRGLKALEEQGLELVGIFHTHLGYPPIPSFRDLDGMDGWPVPWLIVDLRSGEYRAWIKKDGRLDMIGIELIV